MIGKYLHLWVSRAAQNSVTLTDKLTILVVPFSTLVVWVTGAKMASTTVQETLAIGVSLTVMAVVSLRLLAASYWIWRDDQNEKRRLRDIIEDPRRGIEIDLKQYTINQRKSLSEKLAKLSALASAEAKILSKDVVTGEEFKRLVLEIDTLVHQLSYNVPVRISALHLKQYCIELISGKETSRERLWQQRKITFRILHMQDEVSDVMSLIELEALIEDSTGVKNPFGPSMKEFEEMKGRLREIDSREDRTEIMRMLRQEVKHASPADSF